MIIFILTLILACLLVIIAGGALLWKKVNLYLVWNTRNDSIEYEKAVTGVKFKKPSMPASKTERRGRAIVAQEDLVDIADLTFEDAEKMVEALVQPIESK